MTGCQNPKRLQNCHKSIMKVVQMTHVLYSKTLDGLCEEKSEHELKKRRNNELKCNTISQSH